MTKVFVEQPRLHRVCWSNNERPGTDHVISRPMRGLEKKFTWRGQHSDRQKEGHRDSMTNSAKRAELLKITEIFHPSIYLFRMESCHKDLPF